MPDKRIKSKFRRRRRRKMEEPKLPRVDAPFSNVPDSFIDSWEKIPLFREMVCTNPQVEKKICGMMRENERTRAANFKRLPTLANPIRATPEDVVFSGHGTSFFVDDTTVPEGVEFVMFAPRGAVLADDLGGAIEAGEEITKVGLESRITGGISAHQPLIFKAGDKVPNLKLYPPDGLNLRHGPNGPVPIVLPKGARPEFLNDLWGDVESLKTPGKTTRVFWAACAGIKDASKPVAVMK